MSYTVNLQQRLLQMKRMRADLPSTLYKVQEKAAMRALEAAIDATPPKAGTGRGAHSETNTLTGQLKAHWRIDSHPEPVTTGAGYVSILANNAETKDGMAYASYVNDGHRMDRHFVPGLYINPDTGMLEYDPTADTGIVVGTKTKYVKGEFMVDKGVEAYKKTLSGLLEVKVREILT